MKSSERQIKPNSNSRDNEKGKSLNKSESGQQDKSSRENGLNTTAIGVFEICLFAFPDIL